MQGRDAEITGFRWCRGLAFSYRLSGALLRIRWRCWRFRKPSPVVNPELLRQALLDAPCGSSHWWPPLLQSIREVIPCFRYHGVDVVESVIAASQEQWAADELTTFAVVDVSQQPLGASYDLVLCRDALQHLPLGLAGKVLANIAATNSRLLLVGSYWMDGKNGDVPIGDYYPVNVVKWPFLLPEPEAVFAEKVPGTGPPSNQGRKFLLLYTREQLATVDWVELKLRCEKEQRARAARRER